MGRSSDRDSEGFPPERAVVNAPSISLPLGDLVPSPALFTHRSTLHGQSHVARVMVHAFRLTTATGRTVDTARLWAAVYLHDLARTHDGVCRRHGGDAMKKFETLPHIRDLFARGGVEDDDYPAIHTAVVRHSIPNELPRDHPHWCLTSLLKDADGLDRVRLGDLDPGYFRNSQAHAMVEFAQSLFDETDGVVPAGENHFVELWPEAMRILGGRAGDEAVTIEAD